MRLYAVALITWAAFITASSEHNSANLNDDDEKAVDYTDLPTKQIVQPYVTDVEARSSEQIDIEDHSDDFANAGLSRSAVHTGEERGSNGISTTNSSSPGSIYATPLSETSIRLESTDKYPFRKYPSHETGYTEDVFLVENAGNFGQKVQDRPRDETIVRTIVRTSEGRKDDDTSFQKPYSSTVSPLKNKDNHKKLYTSATREPFVFALKEENNSAGDLSSDDNEMINFETSARNSAKIFNELKTENPSADNVASILENDVVPEILPTPQARLSRVHNDTASVRTAEKSLESAKKSESVVKTSTTVEIVPSFQARFSSPIVVADLPDREAQEMVDYMDDASEIYKSVENTEITSKTNAESSASITFAAMLNPLQVGITLMNADQASLTNDSEQSTAMDIEDYPQDDLQRLANVDKEFVKNNGNQSRIDYQDENFENDEVEKRVEVDIQKVPDGSVEIQKSIELFHTAPVHEIHYPPEYIQQTANLGVIETNNIGSLQRLKQPYDQNEQLRSTYDIYQGNDQDEKNVVKVHASTFSQKNLNRHEHNALEDDIGRPTASGVTVKYSSSTHEQTPFEQPFKYNGILSVPNQFDDTLYDQSNVRHNFNGNDNGIPSQAKPLGTSTRQETASEPAKPYVPSTYQYSVHQPQANQPHHDHQHSFRSPETRRPEASQLLLRIIPEGSSASRGFLVPIPRPYPIETEKKSPMERLVEKKVPVPVPVPVPQSYPVHVQVPVDRAVEKPIHLPHIYPLHIERVVEKRVPYTVQRLVVQPPSYPLHVRLPAAYSAAYTAAPIEQPTHATVPLEKVTEKPAISARPSRPYRANTDRPIESGVGGPIDTRFTKYYQKPQETIFSGENTNLHGLAGGLTFVPQPPQSETNASQFYSIPYGRPSAYDYNIDVSKNYVPTAHFSNIKLVILPKKFGSHMILRPHTTTSSYMIPSFGRQILYNLVEKDKAHKDEYVGPAPPRKTSQGKVFPQIKSPQFSSAAQSLAVLRKSRQPEIQHRGSFRQSKMEYGFKPPMVPSIQYDENTDSKVEN